MPAPPPGQELAGSAAACDDTASITIACRAATHLGLP